MRTLMALTASVCFIGLVLAFSQRIREVEEERDQAVATATDMQKVAEGLRDTLLKAEAQNRQRFEWTASWYDYDHPRVTASCEPFNGRDFTAAHRKLPFGKFLLVKCGPRYVVVRVNDRGPAKRTGRDLDLSRAAARALGFTKAGVAKIEVEVLN